MKDYVIISDSTTDLTEEMAKENDIRIIPLSFNINRKEYKNYLDGREISFHDFYELVRKGNMPTTAQINVTSYIDTLKPILEEGLDCLVIAFSSALSGTYNSLNVAKMMLEEKYPERKIIALDSRSASMGEGLLVYMAALNKKNGMSLEENTKWIEENKLKLHHWFTVDDIDHLKRGGRLSSSQAFVAKTLKIKPVLHVNYLGQLIARKKVIGRNNSINELVNKFKEYYDGKSIIFISHGDAIKDCEVLKNKILEIKPDALIYTNYIGPVIGAHSGPGTLALFFFANESGR